jgi:hypothetical protein
LFDEAHGRAASKGTIINGFLKSGIWPVNPDFFQRSGFVSSSLKDPISSNGGQSEELNEHCKVSLSPRCSTIEHQERKISKDPVKLVLLHSKVWTW